MSFFHMLFYCSQQLGKLLNCAQSNLTTAAKSDVALFTGCALFVCNKWDHIKPEEQEEVKKAQIEKISKKLVYLDPRTQIVYLSCTSAQKAQSYGYVTEDFNDLITGISNLLVCSMQNKLQMYYRYVDREALSGVKKISRFVLCIRFILCTTYSCTF